MNPSRKLLDARGLPCPQPVILARKALAEGGFAILEIQVDDAASRENLLKFAAFAGCAAEAVEEGSGARILITPPEGPGAQPEPRQAAAGPIGGATVFIRTGGIGGGDAELARLLMRGFLYALTECEAPPLRIILMNEGVKLAVEGAETLGHLRKAADRGVEVLACGTCLEHFKLTGRLGAGRITNMYEIAELLLQGPTVTL